VVVAADSVVLPVQVAATGLVAADNINYELSITNYEL